MPGNHFHFRGGLFECLTFRDGFGGDIDTCVLYVSTGKGNVLIDTGVGQGINPAWGMVLKRLLESGVTVEEVNFVIFTHADWDHIAGGTGDNGVPTYPQAKYILTRPEWEFWSSDSERVSRDRFPPGSQVDEAFLRRVNTLPRQRLSQLRSVLEIVEPGTEIVPGIRLLHAPGHTPGSTVIDVVSASKRLLFIGDLLLNDPGIKNDPGWKWIYDFEPDKAAATRCLIFDLAAREQTLVQGTHLPFPGLGRVVRIDRGWQWTPGLMA